MAFYRNNNLYHNNSISVLSISWFSITVCTSPTTGLDLLEYIMVTKDTVHEIHRKIGGHHVYTDYKYE